MEDLPDFDLHNLDLDVDSLSFPQGGINIPVTQSNFNQTAPLLGTAHNEQSFQNFASASPANLDYQQSLFPPPRSPSPRVRSDSFDFLGSPASSSLPDLPSANPVIPQGTSVNVNRDNTLKGPFAWQSRFYDRIIRNKQELYAIRNYIKNNPKNWDIDPDNPDTEGKFLI